WHPDITNHRPGTRALDGLRHRFPGAHAFQHRVRADAFGQFLDPGHTLIATLGDDVGRAEFEGEVLPCLVAAHRDDSPCAHLICGKHAHEPNRTVTHDDDSRTGPHARRIS